MSVISKANLSLENTRVKFPSLGLGTYVFVKVPRPGDSEVNFSVFKSSCHLLLLVYHSKVEAIPLSALPKATPQLENIPWWGKNILRGANERMGGKNILNIIK